jgi:hypothetical protein
MDVPPEKKRALERQKRLAYWLDDRFRIPIIGWRLGLDGIIGLVPGIGDAATTLLALYIVNEARRLDVPPAKLARMGVNVGVDALVGLVPLVGDVADLRWKANRRNVNLLIEHLESEHQGIEVDADEQVTREDYPSAPQAGQCQPTICAEHVTGADESAEQR